MNVYLQRILVGLLAVAGILQLEAGISHTLHLVFVGVIVFLTSFLNIKSESKSVNEVKI